MKKVLMIFALAAFTTSFAQVNNSEMTETVTTKVVVKDNQGVKVDTKEVTTKASQPIKLDPADAGKTDQDYYVGPTRIQTDVSYNSDTRSYMFENEDKGYKVYDYKSGEKKDYAILRPTSQKGFYIMSQEGNNSFGYFNQDGDFVVENYNSATDSVEKTVYKIEMKSKTSVKKM